MTKIQDLSDLLKESNRLLQSNVINKRSQILSSATNKPAQRESRGSENKERIRPVNVDSYLQLQKDILVSRTIEEASRQNIELLERQFEEKLEQEWLKSKERVLQELNEQSLGESNVFAAEDESMLAESSGSVFYNASADAVFASPPKCSNYMPGNFEKNPDVLFAVQQYANVITELNRYRLADTDYDLLENLNRVAQLLHRGQIATPLFRLLSDVLGKPLCANAFQNEHDSFEQGKGDDSSINLYKQRISTGGINFYSRRHWSTIEETLMSNVHVAQLGGRPTVHDKVSGYIRIKAAESGAVGNFVAGLETKPEIRKLPGAGYPVWCHLYHLMRSGKYFEMVDWAKARVNQGVFKSVDDLLIIETMEEWRLQNPPKLVNMSLKSKLLTKWNTVYAPLLENNRAVDPYKVCIIKILAQVDDGTDAVFQGSKLHALQSLEDVVWYNLHFVEEGNDSLAEVGEAEVAVGSRLKSLNHVAQKALIDAYDLLDEKQYDESIFFALLCCGKFEFALAYVFRTASVRVQLDALHAAIALAYYGYLQLPQWPQRAELFSEKSKLNMAYLLDNYAKKLWMQEADVALQYLILINMPGMYQRDRDGGEHPYSQYAYNCLVKFALLSEDHSTFLFGPISADQEKRGHLYPYAKLLSLRSAKEFNAKLVRRTAEILLEQGSSEMDMSRVAQLYYKANEVSRVLNIINRRLSNDVSERCRGLLDAARRSAQLDVPREINSSPTVLASNNRDQSAVSRAQIQAEQVFRFLSKHPSAEDFDLNRDNETARVATKMLIALSGFVTNLYNCEYALALEQIALINILPILPQTEVFGSPLSETPPGSTPLSRNAFGRSSQNALYLVQERVANLKSMHPAVIKLFPNLLVLTMFCLQQLYTQVESSPYGDSSMLLHYWTRQAENIMSFAGNSHFRMPSEAYALINQLYVHLS